MKRRRVLFIRLSQFKIFLRRLFITFAVVLSFVLIFFNKTNNPHISKTQNAVAGVFDPIIQFIELPADGIYLIYQKISDIVMVYSKNRRLEENTRRLYEVQNKLYALQIENSLLSEMLLYTPPEHADFVTAKIIACEGDGFVHSVVAYAKRSRPIVKGEVVLYQDAVIGRVDSVNGPYIRIMLISDISSKIPVLIERTRDQGILSGNNTSVLNLLFTTPNANIQKGDRIVTSGVGGIFPSDLLIGYVSNASKTSYEVSPAHPLEKIEYVKIVRYALTDDAEPETP